MPSATKSVRPAVASSDVLQDILQGGDGAEAEGDELDMAAPVVSVPARRDRNERSEPRAQARPEPKRDRDERSEPRAQVRPEPKRDRDERSEPRADLRVEPKRRAAMDLEEDARPVKRRVEDVDDRPNLLRRQGAPPRPAPPRPAPPRPCSAAPAPMRSDGLCLHDMLHTVPPSRRLASNIVHVTNFVRPFTLPQVQQLLAETGHVRCRAARIIQHTPADATHRANHVLPWSTHHEVGKATNLRGTPQGHASVHHTHRQHGVRRPSSCGCSTVESEGARRPESPVHTVGWPVVIGGVADHSA